MHAGSQTLGIPNGDADWKFGHGLLPEIRNPIKVLVPSSIGLRLSIVAIGGILTFLINQLVRQIIGGPIAFVTGLSLAFISTPIGSYL